MREYIYSPIHSANSKYFLFNYKINIINRTVSLKNRMAGIV